MNWTLKGKEIKIDGTQSLMLILSVVAIAVLSFTLGLLMGGDEEEKTDVKTATGRLSKEISSKDYPFPEKMMKKIVPEKVVKAEEERKGQEKTNLIRESELTFYKTLTSIDKDKKKNVEEEKPDASIARVGKKEAAVSSPAVISTPDKTLKAQEASGSAGESVTEYTIQVGAFKSKEDAFHLKTRLEKSGYDSYIVIFNKEGTKWFRVRIGAIKNREHAETIAKKIEEEEKMGTFITQYSR